MKSTKLQALHAQIVQEKQQQVERALDLVGAFYDELLSMAEHADTRYVHSRHTAVSDLQSQFYRQCTQTGVSILTPRQREMLNKSQESEA